MEAFLKHSILEAWVDAILSLPAKWLYTPLQQGKTHTNPLYHGWRGHESKVVTATLEGPVSVLSVVILAPE